ncbi:MAG: class I SAM-dependent methyltransferase [Gammaproteobacteria bacterium]|nr:class I SAM-dependent methyltransferase [Gammaproteobacteria bacterium]
MAREIAAGLGVNGQVHPEDLIFRFLYENPVFKSKRASINYYFNDGKNSARKVIQFAGEYLGDDIREKSFLEFASGFGAVTRHFKNLVGSRNFSSCDIHPAAIEFLQEELGVHSILSADTPTDLKFSRSYDFIFVLSFFSHMPKRTWFNWLEKLYSSLTPEGILLFTTHGRESMKYFPQALLDETGFWFEKSSEQSDLDTETYGQTITSREYVDREIARLDGCSYLQYEEAGWWEHQDLYIIQRSG